MQLISSVTFLIALGIFVAVFYGPWQTLCVDWARQRMFEARDKLFNVACEGDIDFASSEYREVRLTIERMIRFCHHLSWPRLLLMQVAPRDAFADRPGIRETIAAMPAGRAKAEIEKALGRVSYAIVLCVLSRSIFLALLFVGFRTLHVMHQGLSRFLFGLVDRDSRAVDFEKPSLQRASYRHLHQR